MLNHLNTNGIIAAADLVILQNEINHETNKAIAQFCHDKQIKVLYNPAPSRETDVEMIELVDVFTPNEHEVKSLFPDKSLEDIARNFPYKLLVTLGGEGALFYDGHKIQKVPAIASEVVDTTGAGDTFNGAFGYAISKQVPFKDAVSFATLAAHLSIQKFGAQGGVPSLSQMKESRYYEEKWFVE